MQLFEFNLVGSRLQGLRRRRALARGATVLTFIMLGISALLAGKIVQNATAIRMAWAKMPATTDTLLHEQSVCRELDQRRAAALEAVGDLSILLPIAKARVSWAPKLAALCQALPEAMGISRIDIRGGAVFSEELWAKKDPDKAAPPLKDTDLPSLAFSVIYLPTASRSVDPIRMLIGNLKNSSNFMDKMAFVQIEATEEGHWNGYPVIVFRGIAKGAAETNEK